MRRLQRGLAVSSLVMISLFLAAPAGLAQAVGVTPASAPPGTEITVFGDGFEPGEEITVFFGGVEVVTFADDSGSFTVGLTIDELMPPGMHPLDIDGSAGNFFSFEYLVEEPPPPTTTTQPPTTTTTAATTTTEAATTSEATTTTEAPTTTAAPATTSAETTVPPTTIVDDSRVSISEGDSFPWWLFLLAILIAFVLGAGVMLAFNNANVAKGGTFTDSAGNEWKYCAARACRVKLKTVTKTPSEGGRQVLVSAVPRGGGCSGGDCKCVLFQNPAGGGRPILLDEDGGSVRRVGGVEYSARCVEKV